MTGVFDILAEPHRRRILEELRTGECTVTELMTRVGISQSATSKHLKALREAGVVAVRGDGQRRFYRLQPTPLREVEGWVAQFRPFWAAKLDALDEYLKVENE